MLNGPDGEQLLVGNVGTTASARSAGGSVQIFVSDLRARPGTKFRLEKRRRDRVIDDFQTDLRISEKGKKTGIITVSLDDKDPVLVADILDAVARTYVRQNAERKSAEAAKTLEFLQSQTPELRNNVDT